ncbi:Pyridoxal phosphate-dependent transferase domain 1-containing protein [Dioscorea alata]|uniref:Pyridoxal phosphate-dependent transferase domain 1-containing protein n=1 Tax=Dioscorea alata TaxID=55571 RepID=A0ACB7W9U8_DIOAL|nr:Pyridoxal phosphate-dependent transferase domain 1-containing protein [Dioscorea alata]
MGKQKMVLKLTMEDDKKRSKAMQTAVKFYGVISAEIQGEAKDKLVVIGNGVDPVNLTTSLRKKMKVQVNVESVSGVEEKKEEEKKVEVEPISYWSYYNQQPYFLPPPYVQFEV